MNHAQLRAKWRRGLKKAPPPNVRGQLLVWLLDYKLQEQAYGGLKPEVKRRLRELAASFNREPGKARGQFTDFIRIKPGTRLVRQCEGKTHQVTVVEAGFEYNGESTRCAGMRIRRTLHLSIRECFVLPCGSEGADAR